MNLTRNNQKRQLTFVLATVVSFFLLSVSLVFAQEDADASPNMFNQGIQDVLWTIVNNFFGGLVGIAGLLLNGAVTTFVGNFGDYFLNNGVGGAVDTIWTAVRDIFNLTFIFALVYLGFKMILNSDDASTKKWLANIIIAALLVNFSLFITKFIVDFSNILATQILLAFPTVPGGGGDVYNISGLFMQIFGVTSVWDGEWINANPASGQPGAYLYIFGTAIILLITAFVFIAGAMMLFIRFIALSLYMVMSPLMFLGHVLPQFKSVSNKYWSGFLGRAFYAPVYILLLYFSAMILNALPTSGTLASSLTKNGQQIDSVEGILMVFTIGAGFMIASITVANKMSVDGAGQAVKLGNNLRGRVQRGVTRTAGGATAGLAARGLRNTAGRGANALVNNDKFKNYASRTFVGQQSFRAAQGVAGSSFDARQVGGVGKALNIGEGGKGGFAKAAKDRKKREEDFLKAIETKEPDWNDPAVEAKVQTQAAQLLAAGGELGQDSEAIQKRTRLEELKKNKDARIAQKRAELESTAANTSEVDAKIAGVDKEISDRTSRGEIGTPQMKELVNKKQALETQKAAAQDIEGQLRTFTEGIEAEVAKSVNTWATQEARNKARGGMRYENELAYRDQLAKSEKFWKSGAVGVGAAAGAGLTGMAVAGAVGAAPIILPVTAAAAAYYGTKGNATLSNVGWKAVEGKVGKDGTKGLKNEKSNKDLKKLSELIKEADGGEGDDKKDDGDKGDS